MPPSMFGVIWQLVTTPALACSLLGPQVHTLDEASDDVTPPETPRLLELSVSRGGGGPPGTWSSCSDIGAVGLALAADDDVSPAEAIGFRLTLAGGVLPFELPADPVRPQGQGWLTLNWIDEATREQEPIDATLSIEAVDEAGNVSAEALTVQVVDPGRRGCQVAPGGGGLGLLGLLARRRRAAR